MAELMMAIGEMREKLSHVQQAMRDHAEILEEISDKLDRLHLKPPKEPRDWQKHLPRLWWGLIVAGLTVAGVLTPEQAKKIMLLPF